MKPERAFVKLGLAVDCVLPVLAVSPRNSIPSQLQCRWVAILSGGGAGCCGRNAHFNRNHLIINRLYDNQETGISFALKHLVKISRQSQSND
jgi:hypothetical protein